MSTAADAIRDRITQQDNFTRDEIAALMTVEDDLDLWSALYDALRESYYRIHPEPGMGMTCSFMLRYLLRCIRENRPTTPTALDSTQENLLSDHILSGYEAAYELAACLKYWSTKLPATHSIMQLAEREIVQTLLSCDDAVRDRLQNGTLEHALELAQVRPFFAHWATNPTLKSTWGNAMAHAAYHDSSTST